MPDISMCCNKFCEKRKLCHRYTTKPSEFRQSYSCFSGEECFWKSGEVKEDVLEKIDENNKALYDYFVGDIK